MSSEQIVQFLDQAPNNYLFLPIKVGAILGFCCTLRPSELHRIQFSDITYVDNLVTVKITRSKQIGAIEIETKYITDSFMIKILEKYLKLFTPKVYMQLFIDII